MDHQNHALLHAAKRNHTGAAIEALNAGADPNYQERQVAAIHAAAHYGNVSMLKHLIDAGANVNIPGRDGFTSLHEACYVERLECAQILLEAGADVSQKNDAGNTPLWIASRPRGWVPERYTAYKLIHLLANYGADVNVRSETSHTALMRACMGDNWAAALALIDCGADVNARHEHTNATALHMLEPKKCAVVVMALLAAGADPNIKASPGFSPLTNACRFGASECALALIAAGADLELEKDNSAIVMASCGGMINVVDAMIAAAQKQRPFKAISAHDLMTAHRRGQHPAKMILEAQDTWRLAA